MAEDKDKDVKARDTMHSGPNAAPMGFDTTANAAARELGEQNREANEAASRNRGTVGGEMPGKSVVKTEKSGTLVTDIPDNNDAETSDEVVNPGQEAPDEVALQPSETREEAKERRKASKSSTSKSSSAKSKSK